MYIYSIYYLLFLLVHGTFRNIDEVVEFPDVPKTKHLTYSLKMMISREIEQEKLRRLEYSMHKFHVNDDQPSLVSHYDELPADIPSNFDEVPEVLAESELS